jgi:hypothetical protein
MESGINMARGINSKTELGLVLERRILEILSEAEANTHLALCVLRAVSAHIEALPSGIRI